MRFNEGAELDSSQVSDRRGMRGPLAIGGGGIVGVIILVITLLGGGDPNSAIPLGTGTGGNSTPATDLSKECRTGADANQQEDCRIVAVVNSVQKYWEGHIDGYTRTTTVFFSGATQTGCGNATTAVGPFYCPGDKTVYIDLAFYDELRSRFGAKGGPFAEAYVIAHEYGHHIEDLTGVLDQAQADRATGPDSASVRLELQADCYAGLWAQGAQQTGFIEDLTDADIQDGLDAASAVGDDRIQEATQGQANPETFTHGTAAQRQRWFLNGFHAADRDACDTFAADVL
ncbi:MAG: neutral zinc metallopeptidase [Acidimicrobiales bacterium]